MARCAAIESDLATRVADGSFTSQILAIHAKNKPKKDKSTRP